MERKRHEYASPFDKAGKRVGIGMTVAIHVVLLFLGFSLDLKYVYPPPPEQGILLEFEEEKEIKPIKTAVGIEPKAEKANPEKEINLVQRSEAPLAGNTVNQGAASTTGDNGEAEVSEPPRPKPINQRALFPSEKHRKDTLAAQVAERAGDKMKAGHPEGNTEIGNEQGVPSARLKGRTVMGNLPTPEYPIQKSGTVVVRILVDQYGNVTNAIPGAKGTTVEDVVLWEAAKKAALKAKFNLSSSAPPIQEGTISYIFELK